MNSDRSPAGPKLSGEVFRTRSYQATLKLGHKLAGRLGQGDCVALIGDLGAGKTALTRGLAEGLGLTDLRAVSSPTFVLVQEYPCRIPVFHIDLYRLADPAKELAALGLREMLDAGIVIIEWADRAEGALPTPRWEIRLEHTGLRSRKMEVRRLP